MSKVKFVFKIAGLNTLMRSGEMQAIVNDAAQQIAAAAGDGYEAETARPLTFDSIASVYASSYEARIDNAEHNTLLKAANGVKI